MEGDTLYSVFVDGELKYEDIEASSEEEAIKDAQDQFCLEQENGEDGEDIEINLADYKFKAVRKS